MRHGLLILLCLVAVTWFEFQVYPGHSYLQGETQLLVPMLERLDTPGFLSRDLVASNPTFAYTIYDEITLALHAAAHLTFEQALLRQQLFFRFTALLGVFLLARALKVAPFASVIISGAVNAITRLAAPEAFVTNPEATPTAFAFSLVLLAAGFLVHGRPLLASLAAGAALLYDPETALAFWVMMIVAAIADRSLRKHLRPAWPVLLIFALILGNLVQLQAGLGSSLEVTGRFSEEMARLTQVRTPWVWVSTWFKQQIWSYLFLLVAAAWAFARISKHATRITNWVIIGLAFSGFASVGAAAILLAAHSQVALAMPPSRNLAYTVAMSVLVCGSASFHAAQSARWRESVPWGVLLVAPVLNSQVLDLLHPKFDGIARAHHSSADLLALADWAEQSTWGSSMFQFPDLSKQNHPGVFRALSRRSLWADWNSGLMAAYSDQAGQEWWSRWQSTMNGQYSTGRLQQMLPLHIDYYVLQRRHELANIKPAYANSQYVVYDAQDLREARRLISSKSPD